MKRASENREEESKEFQTTVADLRPKPTAAPASGGAMMMMMITTASASTNALDAHGGSWT